VILSSAVEIYMYSVLFFFENMPKTLLRDVYAKTFEKKGLLHNTLILKDSISFYSDLKRFDKQIEALEPWQRRCLFLIYKSEKRGLSYSELRLTVPVSKAKELKDFLLNASRDYLIWQSKLEKQEFLYRGFSDFIESFSSNEYSDFNQIDSTNVVYYDHLLDWHLCRLLALAAKKQLKVNITGGLNKRSLNICESVVHFSKALSSNAPIDETQLLLYFLSESHWLVQMDSHLKPSSKAIVFLKKNGFRLRQEMISWWTKKRFFGNESHLRRLLSEFKKPLKIMDAASLFWTLDPSFRLPEDKNHMSWDCLPRPLRELWLLGLVQFHVLKDKIYGVSISEMGDDWLKEVVAPSTFGDLKVLPNFEVIFSSKNPPRVLYFLALLSEVQNDDLHLTSVFERVTYLDGLKTDLTAPELEEFLRWINLPNNVSDALNEWAHSYFSTQIKNVRLLKVTDSDLFKNLSNFSSFKDYVEEEIPNYGFIIDSKYEKEILKILSSYGFETNLIAEDNEEEAIQEKLIEEKFELEWYNASEPDYELKNLLDVETLAASMEDTKYGETYRKLEKTDLMQVIRYAKTTNTMIAANVLDPEEKKAEKKELIFYVRSLQFSKSPYTIKVYLASSKEVLDLALNQIDEIKLIYSRM